MYAETSNLKRCEASRRRRAARIGGDDEIRGGSEVVEAH
jgi:hypothetical protein